MVELGGELCAYCLYASSKFGRVSVLVACYCLAPPPRRAERPCNPSFLVEHKDLKHVYIRRFPVCPCFMSYKS